MKKQFTIFGHKGFLGKNIVDHLKRKIDFYLPPKIDIFLKKLRKYNFLYWN